MNKLFILAMLCIAFVAIVNATNNIQIQQEDVTLYSTQFKCAVNNDSITFFNVYKEQSANNTCKVLDWNWKDAPFNGRWYAMNFDETIQGCDLTTFVGEWTAILAAMPQEVVASAACRFLQFKDEAVYKTFDAAIDVAYNATAPTTQAITIDDVPQPVLNALVAWFNKVSIGSGVCVVDDMTPNLELSTPEWIVVDLKVVKNEDCTQAVMDAALAEAFEDYGEQINVTVRSFENYPDGPYENKFKCADNEDSITFFNVYKAEAVNNKCKVLTWDSWDAPFNGKYFSMLFDDEVQGCTVEQFVAEWTDILAAMPQEVVASAACRPLELLGTKVYSTVKAIIDVTYDESKVPEAATTTTQAITLEDIPQPVLDALITWFNKVSITSTNKCIIDNMTPNLDVSNTAWFVIDLDVVDNAECNRAQLQSELTTFFAEEYQYLPRINVHSFSKPTDGPYDDATFICNGIADTTTFFNVYLQQSQNNKCKVVNWWNTTLVDLFGVNGYSMLFDETIQGCDLTTFVNEWTAILAAMPQEVVASAACRFISFKKQNVYETFNSGITVNYDATKFPPTGNGNNAAVQQPQAIDGIPEPVLNALVTWFWQVTVSGNKCKVDNMAPQLDKSEDGRVVISLTIVKDNTCTEQDLEANLDAFVESYVFLDNIVIDSFDNYPPGPYENKFKCADNEDSITFFNVYKAEAVNNKCKVLTWDSWDAPFNGKYFSMLFDETIEGCTVEQFVAEWTDILAAMPQEVVASAACRPLELLGTKVYTTQKATISLAYDESKAPKAVVEEVPQPVLDALITWFNQASLAGNVCIIDNMTPKLDKSTLDTIVVELDIVKDKACGKKALQTAMDNFAAGYDYLESIKVANFNNAQNIVLSASVMIIALIASIIMF